MLPSDQLKREKEKMIRTWMDLQDEMEGINRRSLALSCDIEALNVRIGKALEMERGKAARGNGKAKVPADKSRSDSRS